MVLFTDNGKTKPAARFSLAKVDKLVSPHRQLAPVQYLGAPGPTGQVTARDISNIVNGFVEIREFDRRRGPGPLRNALHLIKDRTQTAAREPCRSRGFFPLL